MSLLKLFCNVDDFWQAFQPHWRRVTLAGGRGTESSSDTVVPQRNHDDSDSLSPVPLPHLQSLLYRTEYVLMHRRAEFPGLVSYNRFVELTPSVLVPLLAYLQQRQGNCTGLAFVDATAIKVCHNKRIPRHQVLAGSAARGKTTMGWIYGFKLHLSVNDRGEILACQLTPGLIPGSEDDRKPPPSMAKTLFGKLCGDKSLPRT